METTAFFYGLTSFTTIVFAFQAYQNNQRYMELSKKIKDAFGEKCECGKYHNNKFKGHGPTASLKEISSDLFESLPDFIRNAVVEDTYNDVKQNQTLINTTKEWYLPVLLKKAENEEAYELADKLKQEISKRAKK